MPRTVQRRPHIVFDYRQDYPKPSRPDYGICDKMTHSNLPSTPRYMLQPIELFPEIPNLYDFPSIHADMLYDGARVGRYARAIEKVVRPGDVVMDIGTGTGLLAFLCLRAGASRVHAVERSGAIRWAEQIAHREGLIDHIVFHRADSRELHIDERVDLVISELIGHIAFEEGMIESLLDARRRFLKHDGRMVPEAVKLRLALVSEGQVYSQAIECWRPVLGIDFSPLRNDAIAASYLTSISTADVMSEPVTFFEADLLANESPKLEGKHVLTVSRSGTVNGVALWFDAALAPGVRLSSDPWSETHWKQCFAPVYPAIQVEAGQPINVVIRMKLRTKVGDPFQFSVELDRSLT